MGTRTPIWITLFALTMLTQPACQRCQDDPAPHKEADMSEDADRFEPLRAAIRADLERSQATGAAVAVWLDDEMIWVGGFGTRDPRDPDLRPDEQTQFMLGSDTKKIAAIAYLQLVERGLASVETRVGEVLPALRFAQAASFTEATAHQLMSQRGGLNDDVGDMSTQTTDEALRSFITTTLTSRAYALSPPGSFYNYSNPNYSVLGLMTETIAQRAWADLVQDEVLIPLEMTRSTARKASIDRENYALGVGSSATTALPHDQLWEDAYIRPAGLLWSTPLDQLKLARFLVDGDERILSEQLKARISAPQVALFPDIPGAYGYGLITQDALSLGQAHYPTVPVWTHGGNTPTHTSTFYVLPKQRFAISIMSNGHSDDFSQSVAVAISTLVKLPEPSAPPELPFEPAALDALVGVYLDPHNAGHIIISRHQDTLRLKLPDAEDAGIPYDETMLPLTTRVWVVNVAGEELIVSFVDGADGVKYLAHRDFVAARVNEALMLKAPQERPRLNFPHQASTATPHLWWGLPQPN